MPEIYVQEIKNFVAADGTPAAVAGRLVNFETGKANLHRAHEEWLQAKVVPEILARPNAWIDLYGYASKKGNQAFNLQLSRDRATAVKKCLTTLLLWHKKSIEGMVKIDHGFGEDHPEYYADQADNAAYWRAAEVLVFGSKPKIVRLPKIKPKPATSTSFEIRLVGGFSASLGAQADNYFFQIVNMLRSTTMFFQFTGVGVGISIPKIPGPGSASMAGPPTKFTTSRPAELYQFNGEASLGQDPGATAGSSSVGGTLRLALEKIGDGKHAIFTNPKIIPIEGGPGIQMPGLGSLTKGVFAKVSDEFPFNGYDQKVDKK